MDFSSMDEKQAFKAGFATYCAENNLTPETALDLAKKASITGSLAGAGEVAAPLLLAGTVGLPFAAGMLGGSAAGYGAAKYDEPEIDPEQIKAKEIAETYKIYTDRLKARRAYQQYRAARQNRM